MPSKTTAPVTVAPSLALAAREADARQAVAHAAAEADRLRTLAADADEAARLAEITALNVEKARVFGELSEARDAAKTRYAAAVTNPKSTLAQLAQAYLDECEAARVIESERRAINAALDVLDPQYREAPVMHGERFGKRRFMPRETEPAVTYGNPLANLDDVIFEWACNVTTNTVIDDTARQRQARVVKARDDAREAAIAAGS